MNRPQTIATRPQMAMQTYLATLGRGKSGFTSGGIRGEVERNTMRYYLAIDSYLAAPTLAQWALVEPKKRMWCWKYPNRWLNYCAVGGLMFCLPAMAISMWISRRELNWQITVEPTLVS